MKQILVKEIVQRDKKEDYSSKKYTKLLMNFEENY